MKPSYLKRREVKELDSASRAQTAQPSALQVHQAKPQLVDRTLEVFQRRTLKALTGEDARQIAENVTGFFQILMEWQAAEQHTTSKVTRTKTDIGSHLTETYPE